jgi:hypothetical protein
MSLSYLFRGLLYGCLLLCVACKDQPAALTLPGRLLTQFEENGRWGYLDSTGIVVLKPRFWSAGPFADGVAAVREGGLYGYINLQGQYVLPPAYEYATEFVSGRALVWRAGRPWLIDRAGQALTPPGAYQNLEWEAEEPGRPAHLLASGTADRQGVLDANGRVLLDTVYNFVRYLGAGCFEVRREPWVRERNNPDNPTDTTTSRTLGETSLAIANRRGRLIVPFGRYDSVAPFSDGRAVASLTAASRYTDYSDTQLLDTLGHVVATISGKKYLIYDDWFQDGVLVVNRHAALPNATNMDDFPAVFDRQGRLLFADSTLESLSPYHHGRAWAETKAGGWYLVNHHGRRLNRRAFGQPVGPNFGNEVPPCFQAGVEAVRADSASVLLIDSTGRAKGPARRMPFAYDDVLREGRLLDFSISKQLPGGRYDTRYGFWNLGTGLMLMPRFERVGAAYYHGLLPVVLNGRGAYLNRAGHLVWQQPAQALPKRRLNSDMVNRATYTVASPDLHRYRGAGGWGQSGNQAKQLPGAPATAGRLRVSVASAPADTLFAGLFAGHRLCISNATPDTIVFDAQDSMLNLILQARDPAGTWRDIEYLPQSFCGNSYHHVFLAPGHYWQLAVPAYTGSQPTRLRAKLIPRRTYKGKAPRPWYSNEFVGSVNPGQFWRQRAVAFSSNIMNPYLN